MSIIQFDSNDQQHQRAYEYYIQSGHPCIVIGETFMDASDALMYIAIDRLQKRFPRSKSIPDEFSYEGDEFIYRPNLEKEDMEWNVYFGESKFTEVTLSAPGDSYEFIYDEDTKSVCPIFKDGTSIKLKSYTREE